MLPSRVLPSGHIPSLDGIRAVCVALVIGSHVPHSEDYSEGLKRAMAHVFNGNLGVTVFFVLSGFLITYLLAREEGKTGTVSLKKFYIRRFVRILPVYLAYLVVVALLDVATGLAVRPEQYASALTYTVNFVPGTWITGHLWSLSVEEQFYLIWPLVIGLFAYRARWRVAFALLALAPVFRVGSYLLGARSGVEYASFLSRYSFMANMDSLMIGCVAGLLMYTYRDQTLRFLERGTVAGRFLAAAAIYSIWMLRLNFLLAPITVSIGGTIQSVAAAYLILSYGFVRRGAVYSVLNKPAVRYVGLLSYSLYIWQQPFFNAPSSYGIESSFLLQFPFNVVGAFALAALSYHALEMPFLALRKRFRTGTTATPPIGPPARLTVRTG